ncbi:MAG: MFS transporter [Treponema sp.]|nr:MFS transporter [Treponema sp.]
MKNRRTFFTGISVFAVILALGLVVNGALGISGFEGVYRDALISRYNIDGKYIKSRIESNLNLGKKLYLLENTVRPLFSQVLDSSAGIEHIYVSDEHNEILYSSRSVISQQKIPFNYYEGEKEPSESNSPYSLKFLDSTFICIPLYSADSFAGSLLMEFSQKYVASYIQQYSKFSLKTGMILFLVALVLYIIGCLAFSESESFENFFTVVLLLTSQIIFSVFNYNSYNNAISSIFNANMERLGHSVSTAIQDPLKMEETFDNMKDVDVYLAERISGNNQCSGIFIIDKDQKILYRAFNETRGDSSEVLDLTDSDITVVDLTVPDSPYYYRLALRINRPLINSVLRDMALDSGTIIIVALIFAFILKSFIILIQNRKDILVIPKEMTPSQSRTALRLIEISTFVFMFAAYETLSFIPLYIQDVFRSSGSYFMGLSSETVESLPVTTYMIGIMIAMFFTLFVMKQISVRKRYVIMSAIFIAGSFLTIFSKDIVLFSISRLICGFGFGGILLSTSSLVIEYTSSRTRSAGFGTNAAAFASASISSIPIGGVVVNKFGYEAGILVSIFFAFAFLLFAMCCLPEKKRLRIKKNGKVVKSRNVTLKDFFRVFFSRHVLTYILFINIPFQIIYWGLFQFLLPLYMSDTLKLSQGNIGRILGIFSVISLFAASVSRLSDKARNDKLLISLGACCAGIAMIAFGYGAGGFIMFIVIMVAMGIDNLFIDSIEEVYLESGHIKHVSEENLLQTYKVIEKVLSVFIPSVTSIIIVNSGFNKSLMVIGIYSAIGAVLFLLFGKNGRWEKKHEK